MRLHLTLTFNICGNLTEDFFFYTLLNFGTKYKYFFVKFHFRNNPLDGTIVNNLNI